MAEDNPLRRARIARGMSLGEITARTFLSPRVVQKIDNGAFDQLPGGVYARSYVRTFATVVGLDPDGMVESLTNRLPPADDPIPAMRHNLEAASACQFEMWEDVVRLGRAIGAGVQRAAEQASSMPRLCLAGCFDACVLSLCYAALLVLTAWTLELPLGRAFGAAGIQLAGPWAVVAAAYYLWSLIGGRTLGRAIMGVQPSAPIRVAIPRRLFP